MTKFKIVVPCYNCEKWIGKTIDSIAAQNYENFECLIVDDLSTDQTRSVISRKIKNDKRFILYVNTEKKYALKNLYDGFAQISHDDEDVLITIDGDDWLHDDKVFSRLNTVYTMENCLITYGSFIEYPSGRTHGHMLIPYSNYVIENNLFREDAWKASHLRTFKRKLWNSIHKEDLIDLRTEEFYEVAWDLAFMYPMLEMAQERSRHLRDLSYVYNKENPLSDMYIKEQAQLSIASEIKGKKKYHRKEFDNE